MFIKCNEVIWLPTYFLLYFLGLAYWLLASFLMLSGFLFAFHLFLTSIVLLAFLCFAHTSYFCLLTSCILPNCSLLDSCFLLASNCFYPVLTSYLLRTCCCPPADSNSFLLLYYSLNFLLAAAEGLAWKESLTFKWVVGSCPLLFIRINLLRTLLDLVASRFCMRAVRRPQLVAFISYSADIWNGVYTQCRQNRSVIICNHLRPVWSCITSRCTWPTLCRQSEKETFSFHRPRLFDR